MRPSKERLAAALSAASSFAANQATELLLATGLAFITVALWPDLGVRALSVPGAVLVWLALPARMPFVIGRPTPPTPEKGTR